MLKIVKIYFWIAFVGLLTTASRAQESQQVLMTIDGSPIYAQEFKQVYLKNLDLVEEEEQRDIDNYLDLFKKYKLKLIAARELGLDKRKDLQQELAGYKEQLASNYMSSSTVNEALIQEAYDHLVEEVRASHIMVRLKPNSIPSDTLEAYAKIEQIRKQLLNGADFASLAKEQSEDPSAQNNLGDLGWFNAFKMVYPFEKAAYQTPVGELSPIVKTKYGYHIVKTTDRRKSRGEVQVAHIFLNHKQADTSVNVKNRIGEIYQQLQQGESFESLAMRYSDDKKTARVGGKLNKFAAGQLNSQKFEEVAFNLQYKDSITAPFETKMGWYIVKLIDKYPIESLDKMRPTLERRIQADSRSMLVDEALLEKIYSLYDIQEDKAGFSHFLKNYVSDTSFNDKTLQDTLLTINQDKQIAYSDFVTYLNKNKRMLYSTINEQTLKQAYNRFKSDELKNYHKSNLVHINPEYAQIIKEYEEGILLFALMEEKIWNVAKQDTVGLKEFYKKNKSKYKTPTRYDVTVISSPEHKNALQAQHLLRKGFSNEAIRTKLNTNGLINVFFTSRVVQEGDPLLPTNYEPNKPISEIFEDDNFTIIQLNNVIPAQLNTLDEVRGRVINDYQQLIEQQWLASLAKNHKLILNQEVFNNLKKELSQ